MRHLSSVILFIMILSMNLTASAQQGKNNQSNNAPWLDFVPTDKVIEWRRHIHQNPELSFEEVNTSQYVEDVLKSFGNIEVTRPTKTSVLGILRGSTVLSILFSN